MSDEIDVGSTLAVPAIATGGSVYSVRQIVLYQTARLGTRPSHQTAWDKPGRVTVPWRMAMG